MNDIERAVEALEACENNLRLIHSACGTVEKDAPMPIESTFGAWMKADAALAALRRYEVVEGVVDPQDGFWKSTEFTDDRPALLLVERAPEEEETGI